MSKTDLELNISLEPHLRKTLKSIVAHLPEPLSEQLEAYLNVQNPTQPTPTIPYSLLQSVSQWARTPSGLTSINNHEPPLSPHDYAMIALLAGTTTSPERKFPTYIPPDPHADRKREYNDRKAVTAILNALLSILGSGAATWWAAERTGWGPEWKVLLSFLVAAVVAASESILYIIWESRRSAKSRPKTRRIYKKDGEITDGSSAVPMQEETQQQADGLRQRVIFTDGSS
ncbi:hypothetical protein PILCRDRAFT_7405 [Piloderma croceum F 1598]|uniref:Uncharacterized protein n=1 Tax=Piloderma croceum (strain F 1598) TaxID=765440 RepID=A0A0C3FT81_PILCF|nr:hypothetical protein PILCRDRAFT_7405 [Piloderma croceum F 1598]